MWNYPLHLSGHTITRSAFLAGKNAYLQRFFQCSRGEKQFHHAVRLAVVEGAVVGEFGSVGRKLGLDRYGDDVV